MQIYAAHEYTEDPGMISLLAGPLNIASYYTGPEKPIYIILLLNLDEDADIYEGALSDISRVIFENFEDDVYLDMIPSLFQRASLYPRLNDEQNYSNTYLDDINRLIINRLREEGVISKSELKVWLKDIYRKGFFDVDAILMELVKKEIIKETSVKGMPSELIFLINDFFMIRTPPMNIPKNPVEHGLPEKFVNEYRIAVKNFFEYYTVSDEDNLQILEEVIITLEAQARSLGIEVKRQYKNSSETGMFDRNQLKQVFQNILLNAFEAMPDGGEVVVKTSHAPSGRRSDDTRQLKIEFIDRGCGISEDEIAEIFEFYYTTKKTGTGLGLVIARQIVEGHKGNIKVSSKKGVGTTVTIQLPMEG